MTAKAKPHKGQPPKPTTKRKASARTPKAVSRLQRRRASGRGGRGR